MERGPALFWWLASLRSALPVARLMAGKATRDVTAWVVLAATCDRIARFDLADRAYQAAIRLTGETTTRQSGVFLHAAR